MKRVLYDSSCDSKELKEKFQGEFGVELKASLNPRHKKEITEDLPRGIEKIIPYGVPICWNGYENGILGDAVRKREVHLPVSKGRIQETRLCEVFVSGRVLSKRSYRANDYRFI